MPTTPVSHLHLLTLFQIAYYLSLLAVSLSFLQASFSRFAPTCRLLRRVRFFSMREFRTSRERGNNLNLPGQWARCPPVDLTSAAEPCCVGAPPLTPKQNKGSGGKQEEKNFDRCLDSGIPSDSAVFDTEVPFQDFSKSSRVFCRRPVAKSALQLCFMQSEDS